ncbi:hypothetical protein [Parendozoicomonas haliclonae]|uniref:Uncharacterized protein n=1 Tax=Parendozoicomonas haliclonae TaxID=1960125 RepID=A0A1X7APL3_9GAMM|nr:hypothetical protein [Parendozoicomonas haliclonae]SMA50254.1 hypothetical protein EHSB41UT_04048 [Parendozoicomonas haliclonae]
MMAGFGSGKLFVWLKLTLLTTLVFLFPIAVSAIEKEQPGFFLSGQFWRAAAVQKTSTGWQHIYHCSGCEGASSLTITTSTDLTTGNHIHDELDRSYASLETKQEHDSGHTLFSILQATDPLSSISPNRVLVLGVRYPAVRSGYWHHLELVIETTRETEEQNIAARWKSLLGHVGINQQSLTLHPKEEAVTAINIASPDQSWFSDLVETVGAGNLIAGTAITTTGLLLLGAQIALGAANVRGPCGKPLGQCPCTKKALRAAGLPAL